MDDYLKELDEEFAGDPDYQQLSIEEKIRIVRVLEKMMAMGMGGVYGIEDDNEPNADVPCQCYTPYCKAKCCSFIFALTKDEVAAGKIVYEKEKPFFIAHSEDGFCTHLDRETFACSVWENRPLRCRRYDCRNDTNVWPEGVISINCG